MNLIERFGLSKQYQAHTLNITARDAFQERIRENIRILIQLYCLQHFFGGSVSIGIEDNVKVKELSQDMYDSNRSNSALRIEEAFPDAMYKYQRTVKELFDYLVWQTNIRSFDHDKPFTIQDLRYVINDEEVGIESYREGESVIHFDVNPVFLVRKQEHDEFLIIRENEMKIRSKQFEVKDVNDLERYLKQELYEKYKDKPYLKHGVYISYFTEVLPGRIRFRQLRHG